MYRLKTKFSKMSFQLIQSLSLYVPFIRDDVTLDTFKETFHHENIGEVSTVDFIAKADSELREAFVHFKFFYNTREAYQFQLTLESEQRIRIFYNASTFWSISKNFSKKAAATIGGRKIRLDLSDESPAGEEEEHYLSDFDFEEEWKEEYNSVYGDEWREDEDSNEELVSTEELVEEVTTQEQMAFVSSDYVSALEKQLDMQQGQLQFMEFDYGVQSVQLQKQEQEIEQLYRLLQEKDMLLLKKEEEKYELNKLLMTSYLQAEDKKEEKKNSVVKEITKNGYSEFKKINEYAHMREEKLVEILEEMKQEWGARMGIYAEEFGKQMEHITMMMTRHVDIWSRLSVEELETEKELVEPRGNEGMMMQRQVAATQEELTYLRQLETFQGMAQQYTHQYMISIPQTYQEFVKEEKNTIQSIIKSQSHKLTQSRVLSIIEYGQDPESFPVASFRPSCL